MLHDALLLQDTMNKMLDFVQPTHRDVVKLQAIIPVVSLGGGLSDQDRVFIEKCRTRYENFKNDTYGHGYVAGTVVVAQYDSYSDSTRIIKRGRRYETLSDSYQIDVKNAMVQVVGDDGERVSVNTKMFQKRDL